MNIAIVSKFGIVLKNKTDILPRVGDSVDLFYSPNPKVNSVLLFPRIETLAKLGLSENANIDVIVLVD